MMEIIIFAQNDLYLMSLLFTFQLPILSMEDVCIIHNFL